VPPAAAIPPSVSGAPLGVPSFSGNTGTGAHTGSASVGGTVTQAAPVPGSAPPASIPAQAHGARLTAASVIGGIALASALLLWGLGYGLLGGRVISLSEPLARDGVPARRTRGLTAGPSLVRAPTGPLLR